MRPSVFEKNNLPLKIKKKYCKIIEKYQLILHYEKGIIDKNELINKL